MTDVGSPVLLVFDVNETLLSLEPLKVRLASIFGPEPPVGEWFARMLHGSLVANHIDQYRPFGAIGTEALLSLAARRNVELRREEAASVVRVMEELPRHPDVYGAMERLFDAGFEMVALTNGSTRVANAQIESAGLHPFLRRVISVEEVGKFKPHPDTYRHVVEAMGVSIGAMVLVAAHDWDCAGAIAVGAHAAFVKRPGAVWSLPSDPPKLTVPDIGALADVLTRAL